MLLAQPRERQRELGAVPLQALERRVFAPVVHLVAIFGEVSQRLHHQSVVRPLAGGEEVELVLQPGEQRLEVPVLGVPLRDHRRGHRYTVIRTTW